MRSLPRQVSVTINVFGILLQICCTTHDHVCAWTDHGWTAAPIKRHDISTVTLDTSHCNLAQHTIGGVRYAWKESPCTFKKCAIYGATNYLPGPPFIHSSVL